MDIPEHIKEKINHLYSDRFLGAEEISILEKWLEQAQSDSQMEQWLSSNWDQADNIEINVSFEEIRRRIKNHEIRSKTLRIRRLFLSLQKTAAILAIPLLVLSVWLSVNRDSEPLSMALATAKGEQTHVFLPDGSEVWLNVDSRLEYSTAYKTANRSLKLTGEAFFKVAKGQQHPFIVEASGFQVKAVGTEFNISAYGAGSRTSAFLKEGIVELCYAPEGEKEQVLRMSPGEKAIINLSGKLISLRKEASLNDTRWIRGELFFENEPMEEVFRKVERWYNVEIDYDPDDFINETFTVTLRSGESIDHLMQIMDEAIGITVKQKDNEYVIKRK